MSEYLVFCPIDYMLDLSDAQIKFGCQLLKSDTIIHTSSDYLSITFIEDPLIDESV